MIWSTPRLKLISDARDTTDYNFWWSFNSKTDNMMLQ